MAAAATVANPVLLVNDDIPASGVNDAAKATVETPALCA